MDQSYAESDVSLSPSQILDRLQALRQLQLLQRGKLQKQRLQYQETSDNSSSLTEIVSSFSNSTSYNTFRSILQSSCPASNEASPCDAANEFLHKIKEHDLVEGVSALNLSQESEFMANSPLSSKSRVSSKSAKDPHPSQSCNAKIQTKKHIALDEMPILQPKQDFETLLVEKLKNDKVKKTNITKKDNEFPVQTKKPFLKRGEGLARFGVRKNDLVIQNTKSLPWKRKSLETRVVHTPRKIKSNEEDVQIVISERKKPQKLNKMENNSLNTVRSCTEKVNLSQEQNNIKEDSNNNNRVHSHDCEMHNVDSTIPRQPPKLQLPTGKHPLKVNRGKTWAAVLTKEQDDFLRQLKQSDYYKNYESPAKSTISEASCDDNLLKLKQEREMAEQNMFELLENKVTNESFNLNSSFFNKFLKRTMECSGDSTPLMMKKCLASNPQLLHIWKDNEGNSECDCQYTDCSDASSLSSCSTCKTVEDSNNETPLEIKKKDHKQKDFNKAKAKGKQEKKKFDESCQDDTVTDADEMKANMAEMNAKLAETGELLKERLRQLEDEIDTFRKENINLSKMREEIDLERQKFYEEKNAFEQKFNEEKVLSEYYLAEEKEKLNKQKQMYEKYVREIRGRLNKKDKDEVIHLKKEVTELKEEIRVKDAKSTTTIARLRNQLKIIEKEKITLQEEVEKLKKENRRIQHSNEITRRLTNFKYLEEINKKLTAMSKNSQSEVDLDNDIKYKSYEIERQSRSRKFQPVTKGTVRPRAKSVPNINVTSRYAKYFSQRDALSEIERNESLSIERPDEKSPYSNDHRTTNFNAYDAESVEESNDEDYLHEENNLEKIYMDRFRNCPVSDKSRLSNNERHENRDPFFIQKSNSNSCGYTSPNKVSSGHLSASNKPKSPITVMSNRSSFRKSPTKDPAMNFSGESGSSANSRSPVSILTNRSSSSQRLATVINQDQYRDKLLNVSPEPSASKTSINKTNLNPTEIKKPDGSKELRFPNGNIKYISADGKYSKFVYYNGDVKENFYNEGRIKYYYAESKTYHTTHPDGLEVLEFPDGQVEKRYKDGSTEIRLPNGSVRYQDPKNEHVREEWRFPDGTSLTVSANGEQRIVFSNGQVEVHAKDHKRREFPDGTVKLVYNDGTSETRYASGRVRIKDQHGNLIMDSAPG